MNDHRDIPTDLLLGWHLGCLEDEQKDQIEDLLRRDVEVREASDRIGRVLQPLDNWSVPPPPVTLADRVLARLGHEFGDYEEGGDDSITEAVASPRRSYFALRDVLAVAACIALLVGVIVPGVSTLRAGSRRTACAANLASVFGGISSYQADFSGSLPFAGRVTPASWLPSGGAERRYASNSRHVYLLARLSYGPSMNDFLCPGCRSARPSEYADPAAHDDFERACNISYATRNLSGPRPNLRPARIAPVMSDANPLFVDARFRPAVDPDRTNSLSHGGEGQTVLMLDGGTRWLTSPINRTDGDNVWLAGNIRRYTGVEVPARPDDTHLVPGYPATDPIVIRSRLRH